MVPSLILDMQRHWWCHSRWHIQPFVCWFMLVTWCAPGRSFTQSAVLALKRVGGKKKSLFLNVRSLFPGERCTVPISRSPGHPWTGCASRWALGDSVETTLPIFQDVPENQMTWCWKDSGNRQLAFWVVMNANTILALSCFMSPILQETREPGISGERALTVSCFNSQRWWWPIALDRILRAWAIAAFGTNTPSSSSAPSVPLRTSCSSFVGKQKILLHLALQAGLRPQELMADGVCRWHPHVRVNLDWNSDYTGQLFPCEIFGSEVFIFSLHLKIFPAFSAIGIQ